MEKIFVQLLLIEQKKYPRVFELVFLIVLSILNYQDPISILKHGHSVFQ